ncbi:MAG: hypothetical protein JXM70_28125 [Pirellulales bacterium]|nr:hypothetical protein [Pirellulales bacterium]
MLLNVPSFRAVLFVSFALSTLLTNVFTAEPTGETFKDRAAVILQKQAESPIDWSYENSYKMAHFVVQANFAEGNVERGRQVAARAMKRRPLVDYYDAEFPLWSTMDCFMRWKDVPGVYTAELKQKTRDYVAAAKEPSDATTYNHHWLLAAGLILAYQQWGDEVVSYRFSDEDVTGKQWALEQFERIVHRGHPETLADTYSHLEIGAILSLLNFCDDPEIKKRARLTLDWIMLHRASYFFNGHTAGPTRRTYEPIQSQNNVQSPNWLYFGGPEPDKAMLSRRPAVGCALSAYRPPRACAAIAWKHKYPFTVVSSLAERRIERLVSYFNRDYVLFSQYSKKNNLGPRSSHYHECLGWAVRWNDAPDIPSTMIIKQPCPKYRRRPLLGDTEFHQVLQHEKTLVGIVNSPVERPPEIEEISWQPHLLGACPAGPKAIIKKTGQGRLYLHYGAVMIGLHVTEPFKLSRHGKLLQFTIPARGDRLSVAYAVETALPDDYEGIVAHEQLANFAMQADRRFDKLRYQTEGEFPELTYTAIDATPLRLGWRPKGISSLREIAGQPIPDIEDHSQWPLLDTPYVQQPVDGNLVVRTDDGVVVYDFEKWEVLRSHSE